MHAMHVNNSHNEYCSIIIIYMSKKNAGVRWEVSFV